MSAGRAAQLRGTQRPRTDTARRTLLRRCASRSPAWSRTRAADRQARFCSKKFTEPPEQIKNEIAALKADKSVPEAEKKEGLAQLETALKNSKPIQFKENIALVLKYFDQLAPFMQAQDSNLRPAD